MSGIAAESMVAESIAAVMLNGLEEQEDVESEARQSQACQVQVCQARCVKARYVELRILLVMFVCAGVIVPSSLLRKARIRCKRRGDQRKIRNLHGAGHCSQARSQHFHNIE